MRSNCHEAGLDPGRSAGRRRESTRGYHWPLMSNPLRDYMIGLYWRHKRRPLPAYSAVKRRIVSGYARRFRPKYFVETGTYEAEMTWAQRKHFERIFTIEISSELHQRAVRRFRGYPHVEALHGDSGELLPVVLAKIDAPALFWLDAHYSEGITAYSGTETPIMQELELIFGHPVREHILMIDDARCFDGTHDYPTIREVRELILSHRPDWHFEVSVDIIRAHPKQWPGAQG